MAVIMRSLLPSIIAIIVFALSPMLCCNVDMCSREYSSVIEMSQRPTIITKFDEYCAQVNAYQHCLRSIARSCRGNLEFHTIQTLLKSWKVNFNCSSNNAQRFKHVTNNQRKSAFNDRQSSANSHTNTQTNDYSINRRLIIEARNRIQKCLTSAYNYTINRDNEQLKSSRIKDERIKVSNEDESDDVNSGSIYLNANPNRTRDNVKRLRKQRVGRDLVNNGRHVRPVSGVKRLPIEGDSSDFELDLINGNASDAEDVMPTTPSNSPLMTPTPPSPALTCIIYGDPHLRTLSNTHHTCRCLGAWPLIDHPLFAVQITNSRLKGLNPQITGVTKVTVLVRQFTDCDIQNDLLYEADTSSDGVQSLPNTFIDGSYSTSNNVIRITKSHTLENDLVTLHLDHIGVRVYIGQFRSSNYLNVVIRFRSATSTVKQQLVLNAITNNSLCKIGCSKREQIDVKTILRATSESSKFEGLYTTDKQTTAYDSKADEESDDPCEGLEGYYRISCLYDFTIKGVKEAYNSCKFAQSFDDIESIRDSIETSKVISDDELPVSGTFSSRVSLHYIFLIIVTYFSRVMF